MGSFKLVELDEFSYNTPQEMYADRKNRSIQSLFDHQSKMIDLYMREFETRDVSLELPPGSGKTLVGLLIGEFRRLKNREKVVYCCLNKQLVNQVCTQSKMQYGIDARPFIGSKKDFDPKDAADFKSANCIAVTTYSALFNSNPYFGDADFIVFDDAHSAESFVASPWSVEVDSAVRPKLFEAVVTALRPLMTVEEYERALTGGGAASPSSWISLVPLVSADNEISSISMAFNRYFIQNGQDDLRFSWNMVKDHLRGCQIFVSSNSLLIRPVIPPTQLFAPFADARQRLYMSGTLSERGELERSFGVRGITALPMLDQWRGRTTGRRLLMFPTIAADDVPLDRIVSRILDQDERSLLMVSSNAMAEQYSDLAKVAGKTVFTAAELENDKKPFISKKDAVAILANRLDGLDFPGGECRSEIIVQLPQGTSMHERFLVESANADEVYSERMRNRITQALGRCTRSQTDYAVIFVLDERVVRLLQSPKEQKLFNDELRAEIQFGLRNATGNDTLDDYLELVDVFLNHRDEWEIAERNIVGLRKQLTAAGEHEGMAARKLRDIVELEVSCALNLWNSQLGAAMTDAFEIVNKLRDYEGLEGYFGYWSYILYHVARADAEYARANNIDIRILMEDAMHSSPYNAWIVPRDATANETQFENATILGRMKKKLSRELSRNGIFAVQASLDDLLERIENAEEGNFEQPHQELGEWLGYESLNPSSSSAPDPIWVLDACSCVVAEDKIYSAFDKTIPLRHVDEAKRHEGWVRRSDQLHLNVDAEVITIFLTTATKIDKEAAVNAEGLWCVERGQFAEWASRAIGVLKRYIRQNKNPRDDPDFETNMSNMLRAAKVDSQSFLDFIRHKKLSNLKKD